MWPLLIRTIATKKKTSRSLENAIIFLSTSLLSNYSTGQQCFIDLFMSCIKSKASRLLKVQLLQNRVLLFFLQHLSETGLGNQPAGTRFASHRIRQQHHTLETMTFQNEQNKKVLEKLLKTLLSVERILKIKMFFNQLKKQHIIFIIYPTPG